jgi:hypothetical protein
MAWLAAFWPVGNIRPLDDDQPLETGWVAIVQERRDEALTPVHEIHSGLVKYALTGLVLCLALVAGSVYFVGRVMRGPLARAGRQAWGAARGDPGSGSLPATGEGASGGAP